MPGTVRKDEDLEVRMPDGVILRLNLFRPAHVEGPLPVLLSAHPYGKDAVPKRTRTGWKLNPQFRIMNQSAPLRISDQTSWEAPDPVWWAEQGFAVINLDTRGGGRSEGEGSLLSDQEAADIASVIGWAAEQPWSNGRVGMIGVSYLALSQYKVAALNPPGLKAVCPWEGFTDAYRDFFTPGGVTENGFAKVWLFLTNRVARLSVNIADERKKHPLRDEFWEALTPNLSVITVPILECTSFSDSNLHSVGSMRAFTNVASKQRHSFAHRGGKWSTFYGESARAHQLAFFRTHLLQETEAALPFMRLEVRERHQEVVEVRDEHEWPLARTQWQRLYLGSNGLLLPDAPNEHGQVSIRLRNSAARFDFTFDVDTELTGPMHVRLHASTKAAPDPRLFVGVEKRSNGTAVPFEGSYGYGRDRVAQGRLRLALRELDAKLSTPHQPVHSFTAEESVRDGELHQLDIPLSASSTFFRAGESLRLLISGRYLEPRNPWFGHFPTHYEGSRSGRATLTWNAEQPSYLEIPVIPR